MVDLRLPGPRRRWRWGPLVVATVTVAAGAIAALLATTGGFAGGASPPPRSVEGTTNREIYSRVRAGQTREAVIGMVGSAPARTRRIVRRDIPLECLVYRRRSTRPGMYQFCFRRGYLWTKSAPSLGLGPARR